MKQYSSFYTHQKAHWVGKINGLMVQFDLIKRKRELPIHSTDGRESDMPNDDTEHHYKRNYYMAITSHNTYQLPCSVKTLHQAKSYIKKSMKAVIHDA
jgi:hypothetical protein